MPVALRQAFGEPVASGVHTILGKIGEDLRAHLIILFEMSGNIRHNTLGIDVLLDPNKFLLERCKPTVDHGWHQFQMKQESIHPFTIAEGLVRTLWRRSERYSPFRQVEGIPMPLENEHEAKTLPERENQYDPQE